MSRRLLASWTRPLRTPDPPARLRPPPPVRGLGQRAKLQTAEGCPRAGDEGDVSGQAIALRCGRDRHPQAAGGADVAGRGAGPAGLFQNVAGCWSRERAGMSLGFGPHCFHSCFVKRSRDVLVTLPCLSKIKPALQHQTWNLSFLLGLPGFLCKSNAVPEQCNAAQCTIPNDFLVPMLSTCFTDCSTAWVREEEWKHK